MRVRVVVVIDSVQAHWQAKPVAYAANGDHSGGIRAAKQLRQVFCGLHAVPVRDGVYFTQAWDRFDTRGRRERDACERAVRCMLDPLAWFGHALRQVRAVWPYPAG